MIISNHHHHQQEQKHENEFLNHSIQFSELDFLSLHNIFNFIYDKDDLSDQLALYSTCRNVMMFVQCENSLPLNAILKLKTFLEENSKISKLTLHYRLIGWLNQFVWINGFPIMDELIIRELPVSLLEYGRKGLIEVRYGYKDNTYKGGFSYMEFALKKLNSNEKFCVIITKFTTVHGRSFEKIEKIDITIDQRGICNVFGIVNHKKIEELKHNAEICKEIKAIELLNILSGLSIRENYNHGIDMNPDGCTMMFDRKDEILIDKFIDGLFNLRIDKLYETILALISKTWYLCRSKSQISTKDEPTMENEHFQFVSLIKNKINSVQYDDYTSYNRQYIVCKLKRKDNGEKFLVSVYGDIGPIFCGACVELKMSINNEMALHIVMNDGHYSEKIEKSFEMFVNTFNSTNPNPKFFAYGMIEFLIDLSERKWVIHSLYDENTLGITEGCSGGYIKQVLEWF